MEHTNQTRFTKYKAIGHVLFGFIIYFSFGCLMGIFAKYLDNLALNNDEIWHRFLELFDLRNVFSRLAIWALIAFIIALKSKNAWHAAFFVYGFFIGMMMGYYAVTIYISGFFPRQVMIFWILITHVTPILAWLVWHMNEENILSNVMASVVLAFFISQAFSFGYWYVDFRYFVEGVILLVSSVLVYKSRKQFITTLVVAIVLAPLFDWVLIRVLGGF